MTAATTKFRDVEIRAPRGTKLNAKSWLTEAPLRMLMNNLDPDVAENPKELVVYGGIGRAARNWECFDAILESLRGLEPDETLLGKTPGQRLAELDVRLVGHDLEAGMPVGVELLRDGLGDAGMPVAHVQHGDAAGEVHVALPLDVVDLRVLGADGEDGEGVGDTARDGGDAARQELLVRAHWVTSGWRERAGS